MPYGGRDLLRWEGHSFEEVNRWSKARSFANTSRAASLRGVTDMNWDIVKGKWKQVKGEARKQWGKLTDSDWEEVAGDKDKFLGKLQERYGWSRDQAERDAEAYFRNLN